ncbi:MAG TPA: TonB-dependent receptor [Caulobacteraceae bacterium]|jgi:outer membrane receptor protein involved in Fe transport|nr:TonB-dependent receptor [Caulobacteraceae bacterium]
MKTSYLLTCAVAAVLSGGTVSAADLGGSAVGPDVLRTATATVDAAADTGGTTAVGEVIVTAERREQSVQDVPATIQAFTGRTLSEQNVTTIADLIKYTPNVTFGNNGPGQGVIFMRGLSAGLQGNQSSATIATFPNVALYLDDQSMQFPGRNVDIYAVDLDRVEVLEGPQGTLFGGGAEAGAIRYITNKPRLGSFEASAEADAGVTADGDPNYAFNAVFNIPIVHDKLAVRLVVYDDHHGGYIDNVPSTFTRSNNDLGNTYFNISPGANGLCPNGLPGGGPHNLCALPRSSAPQADNLDIARNNFNPVTYQGVRASVLYDINDDWNVLITESFQSLDAEGISSQYDHGSDFQPLGPLQVTSFSPSYDRDSFENTAWTINGKLGPIKAVYTGSYLLRHLSQQMDYTNYSRSTGGMYYECTGGGTGFGTAPPVCFSPVSNWLDTVRNTHLSNELRFSTPDDWRFRAIGGFFQENFRIYDDMNFRYKTIPDCDAENLAVALAGGQVCLANVRTAPGSTANFPGVRDNHTAFGEDTQRGYDQIAFFGSVDFDIIPQVLTITAGTRWYQYKEFEVGSQYGTGAGCLNVPNGGCVGYDPATGSGGGMVNIDSHNDHVTYSGFRSRFNITYHVTPDALTYFTFSQGFRPGGFNRSVSNVAPGPDGNPQFTKPNGYAPDSLTNYEFGIKSEFLDHRVLLNLSGYYMQWDDVQLLFFNPTELGNTTFGVNGPNYTVKGVEAQVTARVTENFSIQGSATYNKDTQANSPCLVDNIPGTPAFNQCITQVIQKGVGLVPFQNPFGAVGSVPAFSPEWQGDLRGRYDWDIGEFKAFVQAGFSYTGSMFNQPATYTSGEGVVVPNTTLFRYEQPAYATVDAAVGISKDNWYASIYGENLNNSHASMFTSSAQFIKSEVPIRPRVITLKLGAHF